MGHELESIRGGCLSRDFKKLLEINIDLHVGVVWLYR